MGILKWLFGGSAAEEARKRRIESSARQSEEEARAKVKRAEALRKLGLIEEAKELEQKATQLLATRSVQMQILSSLGANRRGKA